MIRFIHLAVLVTMLLLARCASAACLSVTGDRITGHDFTSIPEFSVLPADSSFGYAPAPGVSRVFSAAQLERLAAGYGVKIHLTQTVCFAWPVHNLSREEIASAIRKTLSPRDVQLEIADQSNAPVPDGEVKFPLQGFSVGSSSASVWNGYVIYSGNRKFNTWVRVRVLVHEKHVLASRAVRAGELIDPSCVSLVDYNGPLLRTTILPVLDQAVGKIARWPISPGTPMTDSMLALPHDVDKDQLVTVHSDCGAAHIETEGIATEAGYRGDIVRIRNPKTARIFRAKIDSRGVVTVLPGTNAGLVVEDKRS